MPVNAKLIGGRVRTVGPGGKIENTPNGNPRDGGGWPNTPEGWKKAESQAMHINDAKPPKPPAYPKRSPLSAKPRQSASPATGPKKQRPM